jgi:hypothetical protein
MDFTEIEKIKQFANVPVAYDVLLSVLKDYKEPASKIARLQKEGVLQRLKKGLYIVSPEISKTTVSLGLVANHLYGPSYVSLETALSNYGLIPERAYAVRSMVLNRSKIFKTKFGNFEYVKLPQDYFHIGINQIAEGSAAYLMAAPEKAVCDMIMTTGMLRLQSPKAVKEFLIENLRLDIGAIKNWNMKIIEEVLAAGRKKTEFSNLYKAVKNGILGV